MLSFWFYVYQFDIMSNMSAMYSNPEHIRLSRSVSINLLEAASPSFFVLALNLNHAIHPGQCTFTQMIFRPYPKCTLKINKRRNHLRILLCSSPVVAMDAHTEFGHK